ncbi:hypothetical protein EG329_012028 [Mollisiaceae sp. DMI_Dod_QoI]|nr:hypothetical protein EG329_012028 [Helotiales sp. DMI_Dod_QoI]
MANNSMSAVSAAHACRAAFLTAVTFRNDRWKLHQLHGLHQLLLDTREELISALAEEFSLPIAGYEREYTLLLQDIAWHYVHISKGSTTSQQRLSGTASLQSLPVGVSLILTNSTNPFRYALAPLASSIAAGNTVILATESKSCQFFTLLSEKAKLYLDSQSVHFLQELDLQDPIFDEVDQVYIIDKQPIRYSHLLSSPIATFHSTVLGFNLAVVDDGMKVTSELTKKLYDAFTLPHSLAPEKLTAAFIKHGEIQAFAKSFSTTFGKNSLGLKFDSKELTALGLVPFVGDTYQAELSHLAQSSTCPKSALFEAIKTADWAGVLLVLLYTSFDQVIDAISALEMTPLQVALLAPTSKSHVSYFERWTRSKVLSVGNIQSVIPPVIQPGIPLSSKSLQPFFPPVVFGQLRLKVWGEQSETPTMSSVQSRNKMLIKPLASEPNQTMEFFGYMKRVFIGTGIVIGGGIIVAGLWMRYK